MNHWSFLFITSVNLQNRQGGVLLLVLLFQQLRDFSVTRILHPLSPGGDKAIFLVAVSEQGRSSLSPTSLQPPPDSPAHSSPLSLPEGVALCPFFSGMMAVMVASEDMLVAELDEACKL